MAVLHNIPVTFLCILHLQFILFLLNSIIYTPSSILHHLSTLLSEHKVCLKEKNLNNNRSKVQPGKYPFPQLQPNSKFITPYGIVQVISDQRIPQDHNQTCLPKDIKHQNRTYTRKRERIQKRKHTTLLFQAKQQRKRRMHLWNIYQDYQSYIRQNSPKNTASYSSNDILHDEKAKSMATDIYKLYSTLTTPSLILSGKYSQNLDRKMHDQVQIVEKHPWNDLGQDPMEPRDSYPHRIVECVLIQDERIKVCNLSVAAEGEGRLTQKETAMRSVAKAKQERMQNTEKATTSSTTSMTYDKNDTKYANDDTTTCSVVPTSSNTTVTTNTASNTTNNNVINKIPNVHPSGLRLFLQRCLLVNSYNPSIPIYQCERNGRTFHTRMGLKNYLENNETPEEIKQKKIQERISQIQEIENAALTNKIKKPQPLTGKKDDTVAGGSGSKSKRKKHKKWPSWLEFYPDESVIYPEVFNFLQFKRGSNNSKFLKKKFDLIGPGRKKVRKSRAKVNWDVQEWIKNKSFKPVYPEVMMCFFPEFESVPTPKIPVANKIKVVKNEHNVKVPLSTLKGLNENGDNVLPLTPTVGGDSGIVSTGTLSSSMPPLGSTEPIAPDNMSTTEMIDFENTMKTSARKKESVRSKASNEHKQSSSPKVDGKREENSRNKSQTKTQQATTTTKRKVRTQKVKKERNEKNRNDTLTPEAKNESDEDIVDDNDDEEGMGIGIGIGILKPKKRRRRKKSPIATPKKDLCPMIVDIRPLVEEIRAGRYPSIKEYNGDHSDICLVCKNRGGDDMFFCEFCENAEHLSCVQTKVPIRPPESDEEFMCHKCIQTIMARRARAERRRQQKLDEAMGKSPSEQDASSTALTLEEARAATSVKDEIVWNQEEFDTHVASLKKCPSGGPGGLICCSFCTSAYSRLLSETTKEMDVQTVSSVGREVSELIQLLHDAQSRLQQAIDVSNGNDVRMSLLNKDQVSFAQVKDMSSSGGMNGRKVDGGMSVMGFMDMFGGN